MRVAIFAETYYPFISGVVTHIETLRRGLEAEGHQVMIVTMSPSAKHHYVKDNVLYCPAISLKKIYGYGVANPVNLQRLRILRVFNPDIIHIHTEFTMGMFALFAAQRLNKPVVYTLHTMYDDYVFYLFPKRMNNVAKPAAHAYIRKVASKATEIIGPSVKVVDYLRRCGVTRHINIVPNTVDVSAFFRENISEERVRKVREKLKLAPEDISLCFVGRLGKEKSIDVLIDYFAQCCRKDSHFKLFVIGEGPERNELQEQINQLGMQSQVFLLGRIEHNEMPPYLQAFNLFATASLSEMNSISLLEATASGLYALQRLDIYNRDQIASGVNGEVFSSQQEFNDILNDYAQRSQSEKQELRAKVSGYAQRYGKKEFTQAILNVYERTVDEFAKNK